MSRERSLSGGCSCGRNQYQILIPQDGSTETAQVFFDNSGTHRKSQATPLTSWIRIPLSWYSSHTISYFPDETHTSIRRTYTSPTEPSSKRHFCGFCGTPLSYWSESPSSESEFICLTLGSLISEDLRDLEDLGLLPEAVVMNAQHDKEVIENDIPRNALSGDANEGLPWFDTMVEGSQLGRMRRQGERRSGNGWRVEWEIVEWTDGDDETPTTTSSGKRKLDETMAESSDVRMG